MHLRSFFKNQNGASSVEYSLIIALIVNCIIMSVISLGIFLNQAFHGLDGAFHGGPGDDGKANASPSPMPR